MTLTHRSLAFGADASTLASLLIAAFVWLALAGVGMWNWITTLIIFLTISFLGLSVLIAFSRNFNNPRLSSFIALGPGLSLGLYLLFFLRAILTKTLFEMFLILSAFSFLFIGIMLIRRKRSHLSLKLSFQVIDIWKIFALTSLIGMILHSEWWWNAPVVIGTGVVAALYYPRESSTKQFLTLLSSAVLLVACVVGSVALRSSTWWVSSSNDDDPFFESISHSLVSNGPLVNPTTAAHNGFTAAAYHHLAYFFTGLLDLGTSGESFVALSRIAPVFIAISTLCSLLLFLETLSGWVLRSEVSGQIQIIACTVFCLVVRISHPLSDFLAVGALVGAIAIIPIVNLIPNVLKMSLMVLLIFGAVAFSKGLNIWLVVLVFSVHSLFKMRSWMKAAIPIFVGVLYVGFFSLNSSAASSYRIAFLDPISVSEHAFGGFGSRLLAIIYVLMPYGLGFTALALLISRHRKSRDVLSLACVFALVMFAGVSILVLISGENFRTMSYLVRPAGVVSVLSVVTCLYANQSNLLTRGRTLTAMLTGLIVFVLWSFIIPAVVPNLNSGSNYAKFLRIVRDSQFVGILALAGLILSMLWRRASDNYLVRGLNLVSFRRWSGSLTLVAIAVSVGLMSTVTRFEERLADTRSGYESSLNAGVLGTASQREVAAKLAALSATSSVAAYSGNCLDPVRDNCFRPFLFSAYSRRQFLFLYGFQKNWGFANYKEKQDAELSLNMLALSGGDAIAKLRMRKVSFVIIESSRTSEVWIKEAKDAMASVVFSNSDFLLLEI